MGRGWVRLLGGVLIVAAAACLIFLGASEWTIRRGHNVPLRAVPVARGPVAIAEGARLATLVGCKSCHGDGKGAVWTPVDWTFGQIAPTAIARLAAGYSDAELTRLIRNGVRKDGSTLFVMPAWSMANLADDDVARIIAWVRSLEPAPDDVTARTWFGPVGRWQILTGALRSSLETGDVAPAKRPANVGRYFTFTLCSECHALHEAQMHDGNKVPALAPVAAAYSLPDFQRLLRTGVGAGGRDVGFMGTIAKENLHALSDDEIAAVHAYLKQEASHE